MSHTLMSVRKLEHRYVGTAAGFDIRGISDAVLRPSPRVISALNASSPTVMFLYKLRGP
jgi:hypothetical protein